MEAITFAQKYAAATGEAEMPAEQFNPAWVASVENADDGLLKGASARGGDFIRYRLRENGFKRNIVPITTLGSDAKFDRQVDHDEPVIVEDMEAESMGAKAIPFNDSPDSTMYRGLRYEIKFCTITTPEFVKNIDELRTYRMDLRQVTTDNGLRDLETEEDARLISTCDRIVGPASGNGLAGVPQNHEILGQIRRPNYKQLLNYLQDLMLNNGIFLCNRHTATELLAWDRAEVGGDLAQTLFSEGLRGLGKLAPMGVPVLATIKHTIVPNNVFYLFAEAGYLGKGYQLTEPTLYVEKKIDIIRVRAQEKLGFTIANVRSVARAKFLG